MSSKKCCVPGCEDLGDPPRTLHVFPNPIKDAERFNTWVLSIGGDIVGLPNDFIHKYRRVCHAHFEEKFWCRYNKLNNLAVPTLNLPGPKALPKFSLISTPLKKIKATQNMVPSTENIPSTSKGPILAPRLPLTRTPLKEMNMQNIQESVPLPRPVLYTPKDVLGNVSSVNNSFCATTTHNETMPLLSKSVPCRRPVQRRAVVTKKLRKPAEQTLYKKLIKMRIKISKYRNKEKKRRAQIKASKKLFSNPTFIKTMEDLPSASKILTLMQIRHAKRKNKGRRFTTDEKILALSIYKQSPKAYRFLRRILILPAPQTLSKLIQSANLSPGINKKVFVQLKKRAEKLNVQERLVVLLFDEMSLAANVTYNERKDRVSGFVNNGKEIIPEFADHAQVFMIRGLVKNYKQPLSYSFSAAATKGPELANQIKNVIKEIQEAGLIVVATICDQGTNNRQAIKLLSQETQGIFLRNGQEPKKNIIIINGQEIVPLYDPPHMLKCIRNNLITKNLKYTVDNIVKIAKWEHLELLLKENPGYRGIRLIPKLTNDHIEPHRIPKMKVKYAAQVFSQAVANNMGYLADKGILPEECKETADLLLFYDELFDSVNGSHTKNKHAKPLLGPVNPNSCHHKVWSRSKKILRSMKFIDKKSEKTESVPTLHNWVWTLDGIEVLLKNVNANFGVNSVWLRHLNQDPIENYFGAIRSHGCRNTNPTPEKFESAFTTLLLNNMSSVHAMGNCEKDFCQNLHTLVMSDCEDAPTTCDISEIPNIVLTGVQNDPRLLGPLQYVSGYFLKKTKKNTFKNCEKCKNDLYSETDLEYINYREYAGGRWLQSPNKNLVSALSNVQDIINYILKTNLEKKLLKEYLKTIILIYVDFDFISCEQHQDKLIDYLINLACRFFIYNYCKNINKILCGKSDVEDFEDIFAAKAKTKFQKKHSRKRRIAP